MSPIDAIRREVDVYPLTDRFQVAVIAFLNEITRKLESTPRPSETTAVDTPAPATEVPEWCIKGVRQCGNGVQLRGTSPVPYLLGADTLAFAMVKDINSGLASLRADHAAEVARLSAEVERLSAIVLPHLSDLVPGEPQSIPRDELESRWMNQRTSIGRLQDEVARLTRERDEDQRTMRALIAERDAAIARVEAIAKSGGFITMAAPMQPQPFKTDADPPLREML